MSDVALRLACGFCGREPLEPGHFVAGTHICVCNDCIAICMAVKANTDPEWFAHQIDLARAADITTN